MTAETMLVKVGGAVVTGGDTGGDAGGGGVLTLKVGPPKRDEGNWKPPRVNPPKPNERPKEP